LRDQAIVNNPYILVLAPQQGGHVAFVSANPRDNGDRFWAENRVVEFCKLAYEISQDFTVNPNGAKKSQSEATIVGKLVRGSEESENQPDFT
jgi:hypothetical protein